MNKLWLLCYFVIVTFFNSGISAQDISLTTESHVDTVWASAYQLSVKLTNPTSQATDSWVATFTLPIGNQLSAHTSGGLFSVSGNNVTVKNLTTNGVIGANSSVTFNMIINMPQSGRTAIDNLSAKGSTSGTPPVPNLSAPVLNSITSNSPTDYIVTWSSVANATTYYLEVDTNSGFANAKVVLQSNLNSLNVTNQPVGTYYYRVAAANSSGKSSYSNVQSITIAGTNTTVPLVASYKIDTVWATAFQTTVTLTNNTSLLVNGWTAKFTLPSGFVLSNYQYFGVFSVQGNVVTVKNASTNGSILPNSSVTFSMIINKPSSAKSEILNLQATGNVNSSTPLPVPSAPVIAVNSTSSKNYNVSWNSTANATSYILQESVDASFSQAKIVGQGNILSQSFSNKPAGIYYYRVSATNSSGNSPYSNVVNIVVSNSDPVPVPVGTIESSVWYIDWTSWFTGPTFVIPKGVDTINIFVGQLDYDPQGKPTLDGFGTFTTAQMQAFVQFLKSQSPSIRAKVSIGGGGGSYDRTWDKLTASNIGAFAQGMVDFCHNIGLVGVDFDYEAFSSAEQEALVGTLIKQFKLLDPSLETSLCANAGFGPNYPWQQSVKNILDAAAISPGNSSVDRVYLMTYYNPMSEEINWIVGSDGKGGWANWLITNYGFTRARISVGIDDFDAHAYDPDVFKAWALGEGFSIAHWAFDPARPT